MYKDYDRPLSGFLFTKHDFTKNKAVLFRGSFLTGKFHPKKGQQMMENTPIPEDVFVGKHLFKVILTHHKKMPVRDDTSFIHTIFCDFAALGLGGVLHLVSQKSDRVFKEGATILFGKMSEFFP